MAALRGPTPANGVIVGALRRGRASRRARQLREIDIVEALDELLARRPAVVAEEAPASRR